jgi:DNA-binding NarL/FixJ family response regulator
LSKRILIADDHESVLRGIRVMLESEPGFEVCGDAVNGREAVQKAVALKPDLVVLDFSMPELDGLQAADEISRLLPNVKLILHTMYGSEVRGEALKHGISKIVEKAAHGALVAAVRELLMAQPRFVS